ncbi:hypothetical protein HBI56_024010 [Parastagonospora nodorum]|nr:hypothetical protein HBI10_028720 [Parastagonospora nodorum]KAH4023228.1 hypothetical protein HBI13_096330 [Parastagonospora nodorum]KAH4064847.1 hypothetical protein HBH50_167940 [Parastagonospora nodorum]KAH4078109.1 hypothetical protein HBH48_235210 [Parastagonospora nodorum]KAH4175573.1 hypothetical protein HBH43_064200 [Parastagonospora nodorum]
MMSRQRIDIGASSSPPPKKATRHTHEDRSDDHVRVRPDYRVAIDFGTTFTTVAFVRCHASDEGKSVVLTVEEFPGDRCVGRNGTQVPTEIWYPSKEKGAARRNAVQNVLYGYEVTRRLELPEEDPLRSAYKTTGLVSKPKLLLDENPLLYDLRKDVLGVIQQLKKDHLIKKNEEVIEHLLVYFLKHTKSVLQRDHGLTNSSIVEVTLAVPVCWSARANAAMSTCLQKAISTVQFGTQSLGMPQLFMVNEAEAAAMHVVSSDSAHLRRGECFILLDCGGGTTDVGTYKIANGQPLRLEQEVTHPRGAVCGSSDLNTRMRRFAAINLTDETYLEDEEEGTTIYNVIDSEIMPYFESEVKRAYDPNKEQSFTFRIHGLKRSSVNSRLVKNHFVLSSQDLQDLFDKSLKTIECLLLDQIEHAQRSNTKIDKVVLVGGFGDSPALKDYLKSSLQRYNAQHGTTMQLVPAAANTSATGVATGAIMRAQNKDDGPKRIPCRSIGVLYHVPDDPDYNFSKEVLKQAWSISELSQEEYIMRTIRWIIKAGKGEVKPVHKYDFLSMHYFSPEDSKWIAEEALYASDTCTEDYFTRSHPKNKGKTSEFGLVQFDVTHLQDRMKLYIPPDAEEGSERYEVTLLVRMKVIDRHLEFTAYWPADDDNAAAIPGSQTCFDLSAAFEPGTG